MSTLRISCFGILLKHHLLRHHANEVAPRRRLRPEIEEALACLPVNFEVRTSTQLPARDHLHGEERLTLGIDLSQADGMTLHVQGLLSRNGPGQAHSLLPFSLRFSTDGQAPPSAAQLQAALLRLRAADLPIAAHSESRIGLFQPRYARRPGGSQALRTPDASLHEAA